MTRRLHPSCNAFSPALLPSVSVVSWQRPTRLRVMVSWYTCVTCDEELAHVRYLNGLNVRLNGPDGSSIV